MKPDMGTAGAAAGELSREECGQELLRTLACQQHFERGGVETSLENRARPQSRKWPSVPTTAPARNLEVTLDL